MNLYPATRKTWLYLLAGVMWSGVGILLISLASRWLGRVVLNESILLALAGLVLALAIAYLGFSKLALKNISRIKKYPNERVCLFAFQKWSSYPLVLFMIFLGITLRVYSPIPKPYLAVLYIGIGGSLFLASLQYYTQVFHYLPSRK